MPNPPRSYYNEIDPFAAVWLHNLIREGLIADGDVDTRSIVDVKPYELRPYTQCHFFAGIGGWSLALRSAGWPDHRKVWTGSCPCQPFSLAGKRAGFADDRHLWPWWRYLIEVERPATVFGEQVASASDWLRFVRSDLEALDYAVGAIPVEAASAGADHLRDRYWFVGHYPSERRREGRPEHAVRSGRDASARASGVGLADAHHARSQGRQILPECAGQWIVGPDGLAYSDSRAIRYKPRRGSGPHRASSGQHRDDSEGPLSDVTIEQARPSGQPRQHSGVEWVVGADGKVRRVKSGVRLLAHGFPNRVDILRGFGNAIDPRPAVAFITAAREAMESFT